MPHVCVCAYVWVCYTLWISNKGKRYTALVLGFHISVCVCECVCVYIHICVWLSFLTDLFLFAYVRDMETLYACVSTSVRFCAPVIVLISMLCGVSEKHAKFFRIFMKCIHFSKKNQQQLPNLQMENPKKRENSKTPYAATIANFHSNHSHNFSIVYASNGMCVYDLRM